MAKLISPYRLIAFVILLVLVFVAVKTLFFFPNAAYRNFMQQIPNWSILVAIVRVLLQHNEIGSAVSLSSTFSGALAD